MGEGPQVAGARQGSVGFKVDTRFAWSHRFSLIVSVSLNWSHGVTDFLQKQMVDPPVDI